MSVPEKRDHIKKITPEVRAQVLDTHYLEYFECFNRQLYFEAHEVLEQLWLPSRKEQDGKFYKGLIQLAGAFVHVQKGRSQPALSLLRLAQSHLSNYPDVYYRLDLRQVFALIADWSREIKSASSLGTLLSIKAPPKLVLSSVDF